MNIKDRPTPVTDANTWASIAGCIRGQHGEPIERCYVPALVAQRLENQRDELLEALTALVELPDDRDLTQFTNHELEVWAAAYRVVAKAKGTQ